MFNTNNSGYSLSDIAAVTGANGRNGGDGFFGNDGWWIILLFLFAWGGNGYGWGGNQGGAGGALTRTDLTSELGFQSLNDQTRGISQGICDGFYATATNLNNGFAAVQNALCQGFSGVNASVNSVGADIQQAITANSIADMQNTNAIVAQLNGMAADNAACCCATQSAIREGFGDLSYNLATQSCQTRQAIADSTRDIIDSNNAGVRSILDFLTQDKIATLTAENQSLKFAASQAAQNAFITANQDAQTAELIRRLGRDCPVPAYVVPNPYCCPTEPKYGCGGCGCGF